MKKKQYIEYKCYACGHVMPKWYGICPYCKEELSVEEVDVKVVDKHLKPISDKRVKQLKEYKKVKKKLDDTKCFFCDKKLSGEIDCHHLDGREEKLLTFDKWLKMVHRSCHRMYHDYTIEKLKKLSWYEGFKERLRELDEYLYDKQIAKERKLNEDRK